MVLPFLVPVAVQIAAEFLPSLVGRLGGDRAEEVADTVVQVAATAAGVPHSRDPREILERLRLDAEAQAELRLRLAEIENREDERVLEDRLSARERSRELERGGRRNRRADVMLMLSFGGLIGCVAAAVWPYPETRALGTAEIGLLTTVAGVLLKMLSDAFAFEFGSSQGSKAKDALIARFQDQLQETARLRAADSARERSTFVAATRAAHAVVAETGPNLRATLTFAERLRRGQL